MISRSRSRNVYFKNRLQGGSFFINPEIYCDKYSIKIYK